MFNVNFGNLKRGKKKIVLVDFDENLSSILKLKLTHAGFEVHCVNDGKEVTESLQHGIPNLVLVDGRITGNGDSGYSIIKQIREYKNCKNLPIYMVAKETEIESIERAMNLGASNYIVKPFNPGVLLEKIKKEFGKK